NSRSSRRASSWWRHRRWSRNRRCRCAGWWAIFRTSSGCSRGSTCLPSRPELGAGDVVKASEANIEELRARLAEAEETLEAMRSGAVDAVVVEGPDGPRVYTLEGADEPYRILVERMQEGAVTLSEDGTILFANGSFARMVRAPLEQVIGGPLARFLPERERPSFAAALNEARAANVRREFALRRTDGSEVPTLLSLGLL